ncbi:hypothetical protein Tco_1402554 [Tanacetum coccineum]
MEEGGKERPTMLAPVIYIQWKSSKYKCIPLTPKQTMKLPMLSSKSTLQVQWNERSVQVGWITISTPQLLLVQMYVRLSGKAIKRLKQGESINVKDLETNLYWVFGKFISRDGESLESITQGFTRR